MKIRINNSVPLFDGERYITGINSLGTDVCFNLEIDRVLKRGDFIDITGEVSGSIFGKSLWLENVELKQ